MPLWPFRRGSRRKRGRANSVDHEDYETRAVVGSGLPPRSQTVPEVAMAVVSTAPERHPSKRQRTEPNKLQRRPRRYSFSPGRHDSVRVGAGKIARSHRVSDTPSPNRRLENHAIGAVVANGVDPVKDEALWRVPTLRNKREGDHLPRKMSSKKRRKRDHQREAEIKAMSAFAPVRPSPEDWMAGRPVKKESRRLTTGFSVGIKRADFDRFNRSSDISLPLPESIDSALSSDSDYISYKVSAFEALAPRPTLRYTTHARPGAGVLDGTGLMRQPSQRRGKLAVPIPEATLKAHKRVDSLADDLTASDLRELMERDQRRRARKRQLEQEKLEKRIARRAEKQKAAVAEAERHGRDSPPNLERGVLGREDVGLGIDPPSAVVTSSRIRQQQSGVTPDELGDSGKGGGEGASHGGIQQDPLTAFHRVDSIPLPTPTAPTASKEPDVPALTKPASKGSFRRKLSRSKSPQESQSRTERSDVPPTESEDRTPKGPRSWASFFKWGNKKKRSSGGPSSFSNTSRDSMPTTPAPTPAANMVPSRRVASGVPKRTMSRFREDLPELPMSPPESRMQSPEAENMHSVVAPSGLPPFAEAAAPAPLSPPQESHDTPVSEQRSVEAMRQTPSSFSHADEPGVSPEPQAISLASIDSEGSWFAGRLSKKRKSSGILEQAHGLRLPRLTPESDLERRVEHENNADDLYTTDDEYFTRLAPPQGDRSAWNRKSTGEARPSSDWGEEAAQWGNVRGQQPTLVSSHAVGRVKSREGLLNSFGEEGESTPESGDLADSSDSDGEVGLQRATSIDYGKAHARRISAGSARLLSITPRSSVDAKQTTLAQTETGS